MATDAGPHDEVPPFCGRTMAQLRTLHRPWTQSGKPANLKSHTHWVSDQEFDVLEDEVGVVEVRRHRDAG